MEPVQATTQKQDQDRQASIEEDLQWFTKLEGGFPAIYQRIRNLLIENAREIHPDLDGAGYVLLVQIRLRAPIRAARLVEYIGIDKSAISRQVHLLFDLKLIDRIDDPNDSRAYLLIPTEEGARRVDQSQSARLHRFQAAFPHLAEVFESLLTSHEGEVRETGEQLTH
jgi:DNA-binding MarR family transcriptional regulator